MTTETASKRQAGLLWVATTAVVAAVCLYVRFRLLSLPLERDEGEYAYIGQLMLKGIAPWSAAYSMKLPGVSAVYAAVMLFFGQTPGAIRLALLFANALSVFMVALLGRRLFGAAAGFAAAASYAALSLSFSVLGVYAHATHFVVLFSLAGLLLLLRYLDAGRWPLLFAAGLMLGLAFTMKQHAATLIPFALIYLLSRRRDPAAGRPGALAESALLLAGALLPYLLLVLGLAWAGVFPAFRFWTITYASSYVSDVTLSDGWAALIVALKELVAPQPLLWLAACAGAACALAKKGRGGGRLFLAGYFVASLLAVMPGFYFRPHYFVLLLPAAALAIGAGAAALAGRGKGASAAPVVLLALVAAGFYAERSSYFTLSPLEVSRKVYEYNPFQEALPVGDYLRAHTTPADRIAVFGSEPEIYFYADRLPATGHIYMYGLMENHPDAERMQREMIRTVEAAQPQYVVAVNIDRSWLVTDSSSRTLLSWMPSYLALNYRPVGVADIISPYNTRYVWDQQAAGYHPVSSKFLIVYRKKGS